MPTVWKSAGSRGKPAPSARWGHAAVNIRSRLYIFGGIAGTFVNNDVHECDTLSMDWELLSVAGTLPPPRWSHTMVAHENTLYVFGGRDNRRRMNDMYAFDLTTKRWTRIAAPGAPRARSGHTAVVRGGMMYVYGGCGARNTYFNDLHCFSFHQQHWFKVKAHDKNAPPRVAAHAAVALDDCMVVFGGYNGVTYSNTTLSFTFDTKKWQTLRTSGTTPCARSGHALMVSAPGRVRVVGGCDSIFHFLRDTYELSLSTMQWARLSVGNEGAVTTRFGHTCTTVPRLGPTDYRAVLFGGCGEDGHIGEVLLQLDLPSTRDSSDSSTEGSTLRAADVAGTMNAAAAGAGIGVSAGMGGSAATTSSGSPRASTMMAALQQQAQQQLMEAQQQQQQQHQQQQAQHPPLPPQHAAHPPPPHPRMRERSRSRSHSPTSMSSVMSLMGTQASRTPSPRATSQHTTPRHGVRDEDLALDIVRHIRESVAAPYEAEIASLRKQLALSQDREAMYKEEQAKQLSTKLHHSASTPLSSTALMHGPSNGSTSTTALALMNAMKRMDDDHDIDTMLAAHADVLASCFSLEMSTASTHTLRSLSKLLQKMSARVESHLQERRLIEGNTVSVQQLCLDAKSMCRACNVHPVSMYVLPCTHRCVCDRCAGTLSECPVCMGKVTRCVKS